MSKSTISISVAVADGNNGLKKLTFEASELQKVLNATATATDKFYKKVIHFSALSKSIESCTSAMSSMSSLMSGFVGAYNKQIEAETQLATNMRNTMAAREEDIQGIKEFCAAQQEIGIVGDEVQLAGAQELATYLTEKESLEALIPVMNDMVAQQYGFAASQENSAQIASMLGKVMNGQVKALSRYGYTFTEAQEKVLKYGDEAERAAMLAQVVGESVGGMNQALAQTNSGQMQQLSNTIGDIKENIGQFVLKAMPCVSVISEITMATNGVMTLLGGIKTFTSALWLSIKAMGIFRLHLIKEKAEALAATASLKLHTAATWAASTAQKAMAVASRVLNVVLSANPIGIVVKALAVLVGALIYAYNNCEDFRKIVDKVWAALKPLAYAIMNGLAKAFEWLVEKCKAAWQWLKNILGLGGKKVEVEVDVTPSKDSGVDLKALEDKYANYTDDKGKKKPKKTESNKPKWSDAPTTIQQLRDNVSILDNEKLTSSGDRLAEINRLVKQYNDEIQRLEGLGLNTDKWVKEAKSIEDCENNIRILQKQLNATNDLLEAAQFNEQIAALQAQRDAMANAGKTEAKDNPLELIADAKSLKDIQNNISFYEERLQEATSPEIAAGINAQKKAWEAQAETIRNAGLETEEAVDKMSTLKDGYGQIKSVGSGIESLTEALKGNGDAWQTLTGIVDSFLQIFEGLKAVIGITKTLTSITQTHTAAKVAEATAVGVATGAQGAEIATAEANAVAQIPVIAANKAATASFMELASAAYFAAHATIPFAGFGIAASFVAASTAMVESIGAMAFATGGIVPGNSTSGDKVLARVNSGEMILNKSQQSRLFKMLNGQIPTPNVSLPTASVSLRDHDWDGALGGVFASSRGGQQVKVTGTIRGAGRDLVCVLANETRIASKSGSRTKIVI